MCILFIAINQHPDYPLVIAANRDEYHTRASRPMHWWDDKQEILAGRDLVAGGTWLGINDSGQFSAITNYRDPQRNREDALSRGELPVRFLQKSISNPTVSADQYEGFLATEHSQYNPFNLVYGNHKALYVWGHGASKSRRLGAGCYSLSNGHIDQHWPKMSRGVRLLSNLVSKPEAPTFADLLPIMMDSERAPANQLPETGVDADTESALSSIFIKGEKYGTRTTTLLLFSTNNVEIAEFNYDAHANQTSAAQFDIEI